MDNEFLWVINSRNLNVDKMFTSSHLFNWAIAPRKISTSLYITANHVVLINNYVTKLPVRSLLKACFRIAFAFTRLGDTDYFPPELWISHWQEICLATKRFKMFDALIFCFYSWQIWCMDVQHVKSPWSRLFRIINAVVHSILHPLEKENFKRRWFSRTSLARGGKRASHVTLLEAK